MAVLHSIQCTQVDNKMDLLLAFGAPLNLAQESLPFDFLLSFPGVATVSDDLLSGSYIN